MKSNVTHCNITQFNMTQRNPFCSAVNLFLTIIATVHHKQQTTTQTLCYHHTRSKFNNCRHSTAPSKYLCEKVDGMASGNNDSVIPRSLMDRLTMKNSAGFKVERLWYATSSRMQLPTRDRRPVGATRMSELSLTFCNHRDSGLHTAEGWSDALRRTARRRPCPLTKHAVEQPHDDVVLLGDGGGKRVRRIGGICHLSRKNTHFTLCANNMINY